MLRFADTTIWPINNLSEWGVRPLLAGEAVAYRDLSRTDCPHEPHQIQVRLAELLIVVF